MEELGTYRALSPPMSYLAALVFVGVLCVAALLERLQFQPRATEGSTWWASNGRDVVNLFAFAAISLGLRVVGFAGPIALAISATMLVALIALQSSLDKYPRLSAGLSVALALTLGGPILLAPRWVHETFRRTIEALF